MKRKVHAAVCVATVAGVAGATIAQDGRALHVSPVPEMIAPTRYAPVDLVDGQARIAGEWRDYTPPDTTTREGTRGCERLWDALQAHPCTGLPIGGESAACPKAVDGTSASSTSIRTRQAR